MPLDTKNPLNKEISRIRALPRVTGFWLFQHSGKLAVDPKSQMLLARSDGSIVSPKRQLGKANWFSEYRKMRKARWAALGKISNTENVS